MGNYWLDKDKSSYKLELDAESVKISPTNLGFSITASMCLGDVELMLFALQHDSLDVVIQDSGEMWSLFETKITAIDFANSKPNITFSLDRPRYVSSSIIDDDDMDDKRLFVIVEDDCRKILALYKKYLNGGTNTPN